MNFIQTFSSAQGSELAVASSKFATWKSHLPPV